MCVRVCVFFGEGDGRVCPCGVPRKAECVPCVWRAGGVFVCWWKGRGGGRVCLCASRRRKLCLFTQCMCARTSMHRAPRLSVCMALPEQRQRLLCAVHDRERLRGVGVGVRRVQQLLAAGCVVGHHACRHPRLWPGVCVWWWWWGRAEHEHPRTLRAIPAHVRAAWRGRVWARRAVPWRHET
jgi:hypothetical protein